MQGVLAGLVHQLEDVVVPVAVAGLEQLVAAVDIGLHAGLARGLGQDVGLRASPGQAGEVQSQVGAADHVGERLPQGAAHVGQIEPVRLPLAHVQAAAGGGGLAARLGAPEGGQERVELFEPEFLEPLGGEEAHGGPRVGDRLLQRGAAQSQAQPVGVVLAQVVEHRQHVVGPAGAGHGQQPVVGVAPDAPEVVPFVDHDRVDAGVGEPGRAAGGLDRRGVFRFQFRDLALEVFGGVPVALGGGLLRVAGELVDFLIDRRAGRVGGQREGPEELVRGDGELVVARGGALGEYFPGVLAAAQVVVGDQHPGFGVGAVDPVAPLVDQAGRGHDRGQPVPAQPGAFHRRDDAEFGLARSHHPRGQAALGVQAAHHGVLERVKLDAGRQARDVERGGVPDAFDLVVVGAVVQAHAFVRALRVRPEPGDEVRVQPLGLAEGEQGSGVVAVTLLGPGDRVDGGAAHRDRGVGQQCPGQVQGVPVAGSVGVLRAGVAGGARLHFPFRAAGVDDGQPRVLEDVAQSLLDDLPAQPRGAEPGLDVLGGQRGRLDGFEAFDVGGVAFRVAGGGRACCGQFLAYVPGQVLARGNEVAGGRVVEYEGGELSPGVGLVGAQEPGDLAEVHAPAVDEHQVQGLLRGVGTQLHPVGHGGAAGEHGLFHGGLGDRVEGFEGFDGRAARVGAERGGHQPGALFSCLDPAHPLAEGGGDGLGVCALRDLGQCGRQGRADPGGLDELGGHGDRLAVLVLAGAVPYLPGVCGRPHDPGQRVAAEVCLQELHLGVGHVFPAEVEPVEDPFECLDVVGDGAGGEPPDRAVRGGVGVVKLSHPRAHRVDLVGVFRAGGFGADQGAAGLG